MPQKKLIVKEPPPDGAAMDIKKCCNYSGFKDENSNSPIDTPVLKESCSSCSPPTKQLKVDFLYLDLNSCQRCMTTDSTLWEALGEIEGVLDCLGYKVSVNKVCIDSPKLAQEYHFLSSPTIRINGQDICLDIEENPCKDCSDICGDNTDCRVFMYEGISYDQPPKAMIIDSIFKTIYAPNIPAADSEYTLPQNLVNFFSNKENNCCTEPCTCHND